MRIGSSFCLNEAVQLSARNSCINSTLTLVICLSLLETHLKSEKIKKVCKKKRQKHEYKIYKCNKNKVKKTNTPDFFECMCLL